MMSDEILDGVLLDESLLLTCEELAHACGGRVEWVSVHVQAGALPASGDAPAEWRFGSRDLRRALQMRALERDFEALPELAALVIDLQEELARLRARLGRDT
ncbi:MAG: MerR family transcriptional regulator [Rhodocyclaceae bacterium]|nr:MerR family transcriptional regulator [Rhodocyclaceae bacterium]